MWILLVQIVSNENKIILEKLHLYISLSLVYY